MEEISKILVTVVIENKNQTVKKVIQGIEKLINSSQYKDVNLVSVKETKYRNHYKQHSRWLL